MALLTEKNRRTIHQKVAKILRISEEYIIGIEMTRERWSLLEDIDHYTVTILDGTGLPVEITFSRSTAFDED
jgi:hypothetical protein